MEEIFKNINEAASIGKRNSVIKCHGDKATYDHHFVGLHFDEMSDSTKYVYADDKKLNKILAYRGFDKFDFCPMCGDSVEDLLKKT